MINDCKDGHSYHNYFVTELQYRLYKILGIWKTTDGFVYIVCQTCGRIEKFNLEGIRKIIIKDTLEGIRKIIIKDILEEIRANCIGNKWYTVGMDDWLKTKMGLYD